MNIVETVRSGARRYQDGLTMDYRDWPTLIKDVDREIVIYRGSTN
jgi:hypothetical protein